jgi:hypothetical protein
MESDPFIEGIFLMVKLGLKSPRLFNRRIVRQYRLGKNSSTQKLFFYIPKYSLFYPDKNGYKIPWQECQYWFGHKPLIFH